MEYNKEDMKKKIKTYLKYVISKHSDEQNDFNKAKQVFGDFIDYEITEIL